MQKNKLSIGVCSPKILARGQRFLAPVALWLLTGCLLVDNFAQAWNASSSDPCLSKIAEALYFEEYRRDPSGKDMNALAHGWDWDGQHYLLLKQEESNSGGRMYRFRVVSGIFQRLRLNPVKRVAFEKEFPHAPVSLARDTVTLAVLDDKTKALLKEIASREDYWEIEDQTLYNVYRNPACRYDDRDLSAPQK